MRVFCFIHPNGREKDSLKTRSGGRVEAQAITSCLDAVKMLEGEKERVLVVFDEAHWLDDLADGSFELANRGHTVLVAGVDIDYEGNPFPPMAEVLAHAEHVQKLRAVCQKCKGEATHTARLGDGEDFGGSWAPMCRSCWLDFREGGVSAAWKKAG
jgi:thymidine kinase